VSAAEPHKAAEVASRTPEFMAHEATKPFGWDPDLWTKWATIAWAMQRLGVPAGVPVLDVAAGSGWTSLFLAEGGHPVCAVDLVPQNVALIAERATRWGLGDRVEAVEADMDTLDLAGRAFGFALVFDALHHSARQHQVVARVARHLAPGGWVLFGEPSWLHDLSPHARETARTVGWRERGVRVRTLRRDVGAAGLVDVRRFFQGTRPYESRGRGFAWQLTRLVAANVAAAPQAQVWLAARRPG
jgi:SAM-dependent methyltransferase